MTMTIRRVLFRPLGLSFSALLLAGTVACGDDPIPEVPEPGENVEEVITTVNLTFSPDVGDPVTASWVDADGDGGAEPTVEEIALTEGLAYTLTIELSNDLEAEPEDITQEIQDEDDEHQFFFGGEAVQSDATGDVEGSYIEVVYGDMDDNGDPVGLTNEVNATAAGSGTLNVILRHMPEVKVSGLAEEVAASDLDFQAAVDALPGDENDINIEFPFTVAPEESQ